MVSKNIPIFGPMPRFPTYFLAAILLLALSPHPLQGQSDAQTRRSQSASLVNITEFDFGLPTGGSYHYPVSLGVQTVNGYQLNHRFTVGLGIGIQAYGPNGMYLLPVFADGRVHFPQKNWTPFIALDLGYAFSLRGTERGGLLLNPSVGGRVPISKSTALTMSIGYRSQMNQAMLNGTLWRYDAGYMSVKVGTVVKLNRLTRKLFSRTRRRMNEK